MKDDEEEEEWQAESSWVRATELLVVKKASPKRVMLLFSGEREKECERGLRFERMREKRVKKMMSE